VATVGVATIAAFQVVCGGEDEVRAIVIEVFRGELLLYGFPFVLGGVGKRWRIRRHW